MLTGDIARAQIEDRVREAEGARIARMARGRRVRDPRSTVRQVASGMLAAATSMRRITTAPSGQRATAI